MNSYIKLFSLQTSHKYQCKIGFSFTKCKYNSINSARSYSNSSVSNTSVAAIYQSPILQSTQTDPCTAFTGLHAVDRASYFERLHAVERLHATVYQHAGSYSAVSSRRETFEIASPKRSPDST